MKLYIENGLPPSSMKYILSFLLIVFSFQNCLIAQSKETLAIRNHVKGNQAGMMEEYRAFLSLPNVAGDTANVMRNASFIMEMMKKRNISNVQLLYGKSNNMHPSVYGE